MFFIYTYVYIFACLVHVEPLLTTSLDLPRRHPAGPGQGQSNKQGIFSRRYHMGLCVRLVKIIRKIGMMLIDVEWLWFLELLWMILNYIELFELFGIVLNVLECFGMFRNDLGWTLKPKLLNPTPRILKGTPSKKSANQLKASRQSESQGLGLKVCVGNPAVRKPNPRVFDV